jgi:hypothetical protein
MVLGLAGVPAHAAEDPLVAVEVDFIYRVTNFIQWPKSVPKAPFSVYVIADPSLGRALGALVRNGRAVGDRPIRVRQADAD